MRQKMTEIITPNTQVNFSSSTLTLLATVNELSGVHPLGGDESLLAQLVSVRVSKYHPGQRGSATWIMDDVLDYSLTTK